MMQNLLAADVLTPMPMVAQLESTPEDFNNIASSIDTGFNDLASLDLPMDDVMLGLLQPSTLAHHHTKTLMPCPRPSQTSFGGR